MAWHLNNAQTQLASQLRAKHPGIIIGTIADSVHSGESQHQEDSDGTVDAIDPMIGKNYTFTEAQQDVNALVASRDRRIRTLIFNGHIISSVIEPWEWRPYTGTNDPHTGHWHMDTVQALEDDGSEWNLGERRNGVALPKYGDTGEDVSYWQLVHNRARIVHGSPAPSIDVDGDYGPATASAFSIFYKRLTNGRTDYDGKVLSGWMAEKYTEALISVVANPPAKK
jgi:hypothetical protein